MEIKVDNLKKCFGDKTAVDIASFQIESGSMLGLVGNNGAGKTTLFRLMLDLLNADQGNILLGDIDPAKSESWKQITGAYIDEGFLIPFLTPEEYLDFIGKASNLDKQVSDERLSLFTQFMGGEILGQKKLIRDFSAGNKQKIGIIAAMLNAPDLLILDEPFNFLDPSSQNHLKKLLKDYHESSGATILISSHNLQHTVDICDQIALLEDGHILQLIDNKDRAAETLLQDYFNV